MILKSLLWMTHQFFWILPLLALWVLFRSPGNQRRAKENAERIEFSPSWIVLAAWIVVFAYLANGAIASFRHNQDKILDFVLAACPVVLALMFIASFPGTVVVTSDGVHQVYWFWRSKHIRWEEIVEINTGEKIKNVTITAAKGTKIVHSSALPDRPRLLLELKKHCGENLPPDFPREPQSP